jgi:hypothetical protein
MDLREGTARFTYVPLVLLGLTRRLLMTQPTSPPNAPIAEPVIERRERALAKRVSLEQPANTWPALQTAQVMVNACRCTISRGRHGKMMNY